ncbi:hypothetical protein [Niveispirillum lacus]|uniref:hypothetical protein n=1 Tax=Niveispirillum lacus TaxID=1981099 RepID=UPI001054C2F2|nr:hypothetical protein [Niveispirillum lacus]
MSAAWGTKIMPIAHRTIGTRPGWYQAGRPWWWHLYPPAAGTAWPWSHSFARASQSGRLAFDHNTVAPATPTTDPARTLTAVPVSVAGLEFRTAGGTVITDMQYAFGGATALGRPLLIAYRSQASRYGVALFWQNAATATRYDRVSAETIADSGAFPDIARLAWPLSAAKFPAIGFTATVDPEYWQGWSQHNGTLVGLITYSGSTITATGLYTGAGGLAIARLQFRSTSVVANDFGGPYTMPPFALATGGSGGIISMRCAAMFDDVYAGSGRLRTWSIGGPGGEIGSVKITDYGTVPADPGDAWSVYRPAAPGMTGIFTADVPTNATLNARVHALYGPVADPRDASRTYYIVYRTNDASATLPPNPTQVVQLAVSTNGSTYTILTNAGEYSGANLSPQGTGFYMDPTGVSTIVMAIFHATGSQLRGVFSLDGRLHNIFPSSPGSSASFWVG